MNIDIFIDDIIKYKSCQVSGIFNLEKNKSSKFSLTFIKF